MSGDAGSKGTWKDWEHPDVPEPGLLTRDELVETLIRLGVEVEERRLRFWEAEGVLPAPIRRRLNGATRALYPTWQINLIFALRQFQERGYALPDLPPLMRKLAYYLSLVEEMMTSQAGDGLNESWRMEELDPAAFTGEADLRRAVLGGSLGSQIAPWAAWYFERTGVAIASVELVLTDAQGRRMVTPVPLPIEHEEGK